MGECNLDIYFLSFFFKSEAQLKEESESVSLIVVSDSETPWTVACEAPLTMEFSRQEPTCQCSLKSDSCVLVHWHSVSLPSKTLMDYLIKRFAVHYL